MLLTFFRFLSFSIKCGKWGLDCFGLLPTVRQRQRAEFLSWVNITYEPDCRKYLNMGFCCSEKFFAAETKHKEDTCFKESRKQFVLFAWSSESAKTSASLLPSGLFHVWYYCECCVTWRGCLYSEESSKFRNCQNSYCNVLYSECFWSPKQNVCASPFHKPLRISFCSYLSGVSCFCWCAHGIQGVAWWEVSMQTSPLQLAGNPIPKWQQRFLSFLFFWGSRQTEIWILTSSSVVQRGRVKLDMCSWKCIGWLTFYVLSLDYLCWSELHDGLTQLIQTILQFLHTTFGFKSSAKYGHLWKVLVSVWALFLCRSCSWSVQVNESRNFLVQSIKTSLLKLQALRRHFYGPSV